MSPPGCRPPFLKPKLHKKSKNGFKKTNYRPPCKWFFQITFSGTKNSQKNGTFCWFFEFLCQKKEFEKIAYRGDLKLICLNPFLDSLCNFGFKNGGLHSGGDIEWFPGPQDVVTTVLLEINLDVHIWDQGTLNKHKNCNRLHIWSFIHFLEELRLVEVGHSQKVFGSYADEFMVGWLELCSQWIIDTSCYLCMISTASTAWICSQWNSFQVP